jgi:lysine-N-methylase
VQIDRQHYRTLKKAMDGSPAEREEFRAAIERDRSGDTDEQRHAWIRLRSDTHACPFLAADQLCSVQGRYGEEALPDICATFPRIVARSGERLEVWGTLSCPELARLCLLEEDAMDIVDAPPEITPRRTPGQAVLGTPTPYQRYLDDLRAAAFNLLSLRQFPIGTRLFLLAYLGKQTADFFNKETQEVDEERLAAVIEHVADPQNVELWHGELARLAPPEVLTAKLVTQMIRERLKVPSGSFRRLIDEILATYRQVAGSAVDESGAESLSVIDLWTAYAGRRQTWLGLVAGRVDQYFENYAKNFCMREWYVTSADLLVHAQRLLVRVAMLRFLLFGHPRLQEAAALDDVEAKREIMDGVAVEVFYKFSRAVEHEGSFLDLIAARLIEQNMTTFAHATALALV